MELEATNLYDINKQLSANEAPLGSAKRKQLKEDIRIWFRDMIDLYAMLLCNERRDYTVFRVADSPAEAASALFECLDNRGQVISIEKDAANSAWEIWLRCENDFGDQEDYCYYLFCYDSAIIEV